MGTLRASPAGLSKADGDHHSLAGGRAAPLPAQPAPAEPEDLVPVGTTTGYLLLELLSLNGWHVDVQAAGGGVRVTARRGDHTVTCSGSTVGDIACDLFEAAATIDQQGEHARVRTPRGCA